ncbi:cyclin-dependent kinase inhibitor 5-like [Curcuma longa]|uniref:cyclin-dependent kinase inhibitor 5-like n=1 Tax=Curcuma longa TaxID=136217 RepID=UPI003D9E43B7
MVKDRIFMAKSQGSGTAKYARKANGGGKATSYQPYLGARTRARTLALERLQMSSPVDAACCLQLRSRRLEKPTRARLSARSRAADKNTPTPKAGPSHSPRRRIVGGSVGSVVPATRISIQLEASFGGNPYELDGNRSDRETTPCSLISNSEAVTPGSTIKCCAKKQQQVSATDYIPSSLEMEALFAGPEELQQTSFLEKYNFDVVKDQPLPGRYEWVKLDS